MCVNEWVTDSPDPRPPQPLEEAAAGLFGDRLSLAVRYAELLMTDGEVRGLIGPREAPRIWDRHLLNCAVIGELIPQAARVVDVGSGAGLPGMVLAIARPDLSVTLIEPLARRTAFLTEAVAELGLAAVTVVRSRAEEPPARDLDPADVVVARAVAPLDRLMTWCLPLAAEGGRVLALKGESASDEIAEHASAVAALGGGPAAVHRCGEGIIEPAVTVVEVTRERILMPRSRPEQARPRAARRRR